MLHAATRTFGRSGPLRRLAAALALLAAGLAWPGAAAAQVLPLPPGLSIPNPFTADCKDPPPVEAPGSGTPGIFSPSPADTGGAAPSSEFEQRGFAGLSWSVYDPGCPGVARQPEAILDTHVGDLALGGAVTLAAIEDGLHRAVVGASFLHVFDRLTSGVTRAMHDGLYTTLLPLSLLLLALLLAARSWKGDLAATVRAAGWALLVVVAATAVFQAPTRVGDAAARAEGSLTASISNALAGPGASSASGPTSLEVSSILYPIWLRGEIGTDTGPIAAALGPRLLDGQSYTWAEEASGKLPDKGKVFAAAASEVHARSQAAYDQLKGQTYDRWAYGLFALFGVACTLPFRLLADLLVVASLIILMLLAMFSPAIAVVGLHNRFSPMVRRSLEMGLAALLNAVLFSAGAAVNTYVVGTLLSPAAGIPTWLGMALCLVFEVVLWYVLAPFRRLTQMVSPASFSPAHEAAAGIRDLGGKAQLGLEAAGAALIGAPTGWLAARRAGEAEPEAPEAKPVPAVAESLRAAETQETSVGFRETPGDDQAALAGAAEEEWQPPWESPPAWIDARARDAPAEGGKQPDNFLPAFQPQAEPEPEPLPDIPEALPPPEEPDDWRALPPAPEEMPAPEPEEEELAG